MPDADDAQGQPVAAFEAAKAAVGAWLGRLGAGAEVLTTEDLRSYPKREMAAGWRLRIQFSGGVRLIDLLLPVGFPWQPPRIALIDRPPFLTWPHIEDDGILCLASNMLEVDPADPAGVAAYMLDDATKLIERLIAGELDSDFEDEFLSYWDQAADKGGPNFISLLRVAPPTRLVRVWYGKNLYVFAETDVELRAWLVNRLGKKQNDYKTATAAYLWLEKPPIPNGYPQIGRDLSRLVTTAGAEGIALLSELIRPLPDKIVAALGFMTANGPALAGVVLPQPPALPRGAHNPLLKGFRAETVPDRILLSRYLGGTALVRRSIERADPDWIYGRGQDSRAAQLREKMVSVIGCGSVGAAVAIALAQAGVGHIILIDFDLLKWANIGRHPLGATYVGHPKSKALAEKLRADFPHITAAHYECDADTAVRRCGDVLARCQLIVSATGSWSADSRLDAWQETARRSVPILYGWLEAHACAGHALLINGQEANLLSGFDKTGLPRFEVTTWPDGATLRREPACGGAFQPYGPVELGFVNNVIAELGLDLLLGEATSAIHRIWVSSRKHLVQNGGRWSAAWRADPAFRDEGGFILQRPWLAATDEIGAEVRAA